MSELVNLLDGEMDLASTPVVGSTFKLTLPLPAVSARYEPSLPRIQRAWSRCTIDSQSQTRGLLRRWPWVEVRLFMRRTFM
nr:hypothetical protein [Ectothiorhodospira shaposhnikovii]